MAADNPSPVIFAAGSGDDLDDFPEFFRCCVCLELLYKPVVLACGHVSCFWCVHHAMNSNYVSNCPICRQPYLHFPSICLLLDRLLFKMTPVIYEKRKKMLLEEENRTGFFSPEIPSYLPVNNSATEEIAGDKERAAVKVVDVNENVNSVSSKQVSVADVSCSSCNQLLVQPVVLNCGHVYCKTCLDPLDKTLKCQVCQSPHPSEYPKVCLELDHFLEEQFLADYSARRELLHHKLTNCQKEGTISEYHEQDVPGKQGSKSSMMSKIFGIAALNHGNANVNYGIGCDSCGLYPIIGKWYRCMDCPEKVGFDLCEGCYETKSKLPGRFNQRHTADHRVKLVERRYELMRHILRQLMVDDDSVMPEPSDHESHENLEYPPSDLEPDGNVEDPPSDHESDGNLEDRPSSS